VRLSATLPGVSAKARPHAARSPPPNDARRRVKARSRDPPPRSPLAPPRASYFFPPAFIASLVATAFSFSARSIHPFLW
jgi:hypothetical protein